MLSYRLVLYALKAAIRDKMILSLVVALGLACSLSMFLGSVAITEQNHFSVVFAAAGIRMSVVLGLVLFVVFYIRRSFESKDVEFLLSRPLTKLQFVLSYSVAFIALAVMMGVLQGICIYIMGGHVMTQGYILWILSAILENTIMVSVALFFSMILSSAATAAMASFGLYALARMIGQILGVIESGANFPGSDFLNLIMQGISIVIPRLDLMTQSSWLIYGVAEGASYSMAFIQGIIFTIFIFLATTLDLVRRQF